MRDTMTYFTITFTDGGGDTTVGGDPFAQPVYGNPCHECIGRHVGPDNCAHSCHERDAFRSYDEKGYRLPQ